MQQVDIAGHVVNFSYASPVEFEPKQCNTWSPWVSYHKTNEHDSHIKDQRSNHETVSVSSL